MPALGPCLHSGRTRESVCKEGTVSASRYQTRMPATAHLRQPVPAAPAADGAYHTLAAAAPAAVPTPYAPAVFVWAGFPKALDLLASPCRRPAPANSADALHSPLPIVRSQHPIACTRRFRRNLTLTDGWGKGRFFDGSQSAKSLLEQHLVEILFDILTLCLPLAGRVTLRWALVTVRGALVILRLTLAALRTLRLTAMSPWTVPTLRLPLPSERLANHAEPQSRRCGCLGRGLRCPTRRITLLPTHLGGYSHAS